MIVTAPIYLSGATPSLGFSPELLFISKRATRCLPSMMRQEHPSLPVSPIAARKVVGRCWTASQTPVAMNSIVPSQPSAAAEQHRIDMVDQAAQPVLERNPEMELREAAQKIEVMLAPGHNVVEVVARRDGGAGHQQQDFGERTHDPGRLPIVGKFGKNARKAAARRACDTSSPANMMLRSCMIALPAESTATGESRTNVNAKSSQSDVNLTSEPWLQTLCTRL